MTNKPTIGLIGFGFIGRAVAHGFGLHAKIEIYDKYLAPHNTEARLEAAVNNSRFVFVGVPTPTRADGTQDLANLDSAVESDVRVATSDKDILLKSTILPGTTRRYAEMYPHHDFVANPEFLTERAAFLDFINSTRIIVGSPNQQVQQRVRGLFRLVFPHTPIFECSWEAAELVKYTENCFYAMKVSFCNEIYDTCKALGLDYDDIKNMWLAGGRTGNSHVNVPGWSGGRGYGGKCFPKDVKTFVEFCKSQLHIPADMLRATDSVNERVRESRDWEKIKGATSEYDYKETK